MKPGDIPRPAPIDRLKFGHVSPGLPTLRTVKKALKFQNNHKRLEFLLARAIPEITKNKVNLALVEWINEKGGYLPPSQ